MDTYSKKPHTFEDGKAYLYLYANSTEREDLIIDQLIDLSTYRSVSPDCSSDDIEIQAKCAID